MLEKQGRFYKHLYKHLPRLILGGLAFLLAVTFSFLANAPVNAQSSNFCAAGEQPTFRFGFAELKRQMGDTIGEPLECEHYDEEGDAYQKTTTGQLHYDKSTGRTSFTPNTTAVAPTPTVDNFCAPGEQPTFRFGFAELKRERGDEIGDPLECEHYDERGNAHQKTTTGQLYYEKSTGRTNFTPNGPQMTEGTGSANSSGNSSASSEPAGNVAPPANCSLATTISQTAGPYYKANAPFRNNLIETGMAGDRFVLTGRVMTTDCQPVAGALLDFWHTDAFGSYDNSGYRLRGRLYADDQGYYRLVTIVPGLYPGRTRHIHVKVSRPGGAVLTTQLYFPSEAGNRSDGIYRSSLEMATTTTANGSMTGTFDFVLAR